MIESKRIILRDYNEDDLDGIHAYASDPEVTRFTSWGPNSRDESNYFLQAALALKRTPNRQHYELAIELKETGELVGGCELRITSPESKSGTIGYCVSRGLWKQGLATEAAFLMLHFGFHELNLHRISATCDPHNLASIRVLEKIGMQPEGWLRESRSVRSEWHDEILFSILESEWCGTELRLG